jgi:hypothetical protein
MSIWNVQPYLHAGYQYLHQMGCTRWMEWMEPARWDLYTVAYTSVQLTNLEISYMFI